MTVRFNQAAGDGDGERFGVPPRLLVPARVVVVDNDGALRLNGYDVELAGDGAEVLARLARLRADLVVLDVLSLAERCYLASRAAALPEQEVVLPPAHALG